MDEFHEILSISEAFKDNPQLRQALAVRLLDDTNMYGQTITDTVTPEALQGKTRYSLQVHPYPWKPAGASIVPIWQDENLTPHVVMVYNRNKDSRPQEERRNKPVDCWRLSEGFMQPAACQNLLNKDNRAISRIDADAMDAAEELILKQGLSPKEAYSQINSTPITQDSSPDGCLENTARREALEEVGLDLSGVTLHQVNNNQSLNNSIPCSPFINHWFLAVLNNKEKPALMPNGSEISEAHWFSIDSFEITLKNQAIVVTANEVEVPLRYALMVGQALMEYYRLGIHEQSKAFCSSRKNAVQNLKFFKFGGDKNKYHDAVAINPTKQLAASLNLEPSQIYDIQNLATDKNACLKNFEYLAHLQNLSAYYQCLESEISAYTSNHLSSS